MSERPLPLPNHTITDTAAEGMRLNFKLRGVSEEFRSEVEPALQDATTRLKAQTVNGDLDLPPWRQSAIKALVSGKQEDALATLAALRERKREIPPQRARAEQELRLVESELAELDGVTAWMKAGPDRLQRPDGSLWHKLRDAQRDGRVLALRAEDDLTPFFKNEPQVFLVEHDWAKAFEGATDFAEGEYRLPFEHCCFEFVISGRRILILMRSIDEEQHRSVFFYHAGSRWMAGWIGDLTVEPERAGHEETHAMNLLIHRNVRAICIALDAEVAVSEVVRAPHKLNAAREKAGRPLLNDFHVVNLSRRSRVSALPSTGEHEAKWHPRLHFRRGHWRHYETHKTWIKWMLVGNPDLGFIDKHYRA